jgi:hypothetical protein
MGLSDLNLSIKIMLKKEKLHAIYVTAEVL